MVKLQTKQKDVVVKQIIQQIIHDIAVATGTVVDPELKQFVRDMLLSPSPLSTQKKSPSVQKPSLSPSPSPSPFSQTMKSFKQQTKKSLKQQTPTPIQKTPTSIQKTPSDTKKTQDKKQQTQRRDSTIKKQKSNPQIKRIHDLLKKTLDTTDARKQSKSPKSVSFDI